MTTTTTVTSVTNRTGSPIIVTRTHVPQYTRRRNDHRPSASDTQQNLDQVQFDDDNTDDELSSSFLQTSDRLTRDYVKSHFQDADRLLNTALARSSFVIAVFGDTSFSKGAHTDPPFLRQLQSRASIVATFSIPIVSDDRHFAKVDATIAVIALLAARWPILNSVLENHGIILAIVNAMHAWSNTPIIIARCMTALRVLAVTDSVRKQIMVDGGLNLTLHLMQRYPADQRIQLRAPAVVANVAFGCTHRKRKIARQGALRYVLQSMETFPLDEDIQLRGALTIRNLTHQAQVNQYIAGNEGAIQIVCEALMRFRASSTRPELRIHCVMALESLCREDERNRQRIVDIEFGPNCRHKQTNPNGVVVPTSTEQNHDLSNGSYVNEEGDIVVDEEEILLEYTTSDFCHGGALIPGRSARQADTQTPVSRSVSSDPQASENNRIRVERRSGIDDDGYGNCKMDEQRVSLFRTILHTIRRDPDEELLVETALSLLTLVSMHRAEVQRRIGELGGIRVAIAAMRRHHNNCAVITKACGLIRGLCFEDCNRAQISSGLGVLVEATRDHCHDSEIAREIVSALSNAVFEHEKNRALVVKKGGIMAVGMVMEKCCGIDVMALEACICALRNFVSTSKSGAACASDEGVVKSVIGALKRTNDEKSKSMDLVREQCLLLLVALMHLAPQTKGQMVDVKAAQWIRQTLSRLGTREFAEVHMEATKLLGVLDDVERRRDNSDARLGHRISPPPATNVIGWRTPRGLFGALTFGRLQKARRTTGPTADVKFEFPRVSGVSTVEGSQSSGRNYARISARFWRNTALP